MGSIGQSRFQARDGQGAADLSRILALRARAFPALSDCESDRFDALCRHVLIEDVGTGSLVACFRLLPLASGDEVAGSYSAQYYDLSALAAWPGRLSELGRFCLDPDRHDPDILRVAWSALTAHVDMAGVEMLFGCASFEGTDPAPYSDAFALLRARHLAPAAWHPGPKAPERVDYGQAPAQRPDLKRAHATLPPLLRTYLMMGGQVSDHAVIDRQMNTLHVFTGVEIAAIPPARAARLRALSRSAQDPEAEPQA